MPNRTLDRRRRDDDDRAEEAQPQRKDERILDLQRSAGNAAVARLLARDAVDKDATGSVHIAGLGDIKVRGGNLQAWAGKDSYDWVEVNSDPGKHSKKLEKLATDRTRMDIKVSITPRQQEGENLNVGGGYVLDIKDARIKGYAVEDGVEKWRVADFQDVRRTKITRSIGAG